MYMPILAICVSGCTDLVQAGQEASHYARGHIHNTAGKVQDWVRYSPPSTTPQAPQTAYCYKAMSDVVCYERPQPKMSNPLVGYQGQAVWHASGQTYNTMPVDTGHGVSQSTPFFVKEAPYVKADGTMTQSTKVMHSYNGNSGSSVSSASTTVSDNNNPQSLMPRY